MCAYSDLNTHLRMIMSLFFCIKITKGDMTVLIKWRTILIKDIFKKKSVLPAKSESCGVTNKVLLTSNMKKIKKKHYLGN